MFQFHQQQVIVTGGGSGIGQAICVAFAQQGAAVHIVDLQEAYCHQTLSLIKEAGREAFAYGADVSNQEAVQQMVSRIGKVDILVNNAGIAHIGKAHTTSEEDFDRVYQVNVKGAYNMLHAVLPVMQQQGGGVVLNMCSIAAHLGLNDRFAYSMSKGAIYAMTLSVAKDYLADNIRCNCISPARV
ncbi:MAG TPA: SDR family oxidoreductase, partial [Phnomibacter sp.]|nr:SDR family oxidoreductase [Phnomibacter sp.]